MDEETLLRALADAPGDVQVRLVYADWLEERGDPRAEYLRAEDRLRSASPRDPSRQALGRSLRGLRKAQDPGWMARIEPDAPAPGWLSPGDRRPPRAGLEDWHRWASESHYEFVVLAALAPVEAVALVLVETRLRTQPESARASGAWRPAVPVRRGRPYESVHPIIPFVQIKGQTWTVAMYCTFNLTMPSYDAAQGDARVLSERLGTLAVEYSHEDTSSSTGYHLFDCGELVEFSEWDGGDDRFASRRRTQPPWDAIPRGYPDELFRSLGLYVPGFYAGDSPRGPCVKLGVPEPADFARADLLDLAPTFGTVNVPELVGEGEEFMEVHRLGGAEEDWDGPDPGDEDIPF